MREKTSTNEATCLSLASHLALMHVLKLGKSPRHASDGAASGFTIKLSEKEVRNDALGEFGGIRRSSSSRGISSVSFQGDYRTAIVKPRFPRAPSLAAGQRPRPRREDRDT